MKDNTDNRLIKIYLDEEPKPISVVKPPVKILLDTTKLTDGKHTLKVIARSSEGKEGIKVIPFEVRNGPDISVTGISENDVVDGKTPITINAYGSERKDLFIVSGSENPTAIPAWVWVALLGFVGWALFYFIMYWDPDKYSSFF